MSSVRVLPGGRSLIAMLLVAALSPATTSADESDKSLTAFFARFCNECHANGANEGGLALDKLGSDLQDAATFVTWEEIYDRVRTGEMPPQGETQPDDSQRKAFHELLGKRLTTAHAAHKGTVLRRLNRREYQNTMNDLFGTTVSVLELLPEDGRSHEFDNVGSSLGLSAVHLQRYMDVANLVLDDAIANTTAPPESILLNASYRGRGERSRVGKTWKELEDGTVVRFSGGYLLEGQMRETNVRERGRYRITVNSFAYQSKEPLTYAVIATTYARGKDRPVLGFFSVPPNRLTPRTFEAFLEARYMLVIDPHAIADPDRYKRKSIEGYKGPGLAIQNVTVEGPLTDEFPTRGHRLIFDGIERKEVPPRNPSDRRRRGYKPQFEVVSTDERGDDDQSLRRVAAAAFRRPVTDADVAPYLALFEQERKQGASFEESLRAAVVAIFCSPKFLYLPENSKRLDDFALAVRLSLFLSRTTVDGELLKVAAAGQLTADPDELRKQTERLLNDPRFERFLVDFSDAWLDLRELKATFPDSRLYPEFDEYLRFSLPLETRAFLQELIQSNLPVTNLVKSDFAMLNERLAEHYGIPDVAGAQIRKVPLPPDSVRGGFLSQAAILKVTANGTNTSPVTRGAWVMERILGETPKPPPPGTPGVEPDTRGAVTLRELLDKHRQLASCNSCHKKIDPPGFALECFDPTGAFRDRFRLNGNGERVNKAFRGRRVRYQLGAPVDSSGQLADGRKFAGFAQFRDYLAQEEEMLATTLTRKLLTFATGRELGFSDRPEVEQIVKAAAADGYRVRDLIHLCVQSDIFQNE